MSSALVPYRTPTTSTSLTPSRYATTLSARLFTAQTGQALAAELFYRLLFDVLNRVLHTLHRELTFQLEKLSSFLERRYASRSETLDAVKAAQREADTHGTEGLRITEEVSKAAMHRGFIGGPGGGGFTPCSTSQGGGWRRPRGWVGDVLDGIQEGRMVERDFWVHPFVN